MAQAARIASVEETLRHLEERIRELEGAPPAAQVVFQIETFAPEPYRPKRPIPIVVQTRGVDGFVASFTDANIHSSGDTQQEAFENVKELILDVFDSLRSLPPSKLGPKPARQLAVLREFLDATDNKRARRQNREETKGRDRNQKKSA